MVDLIEKIHSHHKDLSPSKVARKYEYLAENPFRFFRGTNTLFFEDLTQSGIPESPVSWICGDLHLENFGSYKGDNRLVYFDLNDFDESTLAPVAWDLVRMITSILVAFNAMHITDYEAIEAAQLFLQKYAATVANGNPKHIESRTANGIVKKFLAKVEARTQRQAIEKRTRTKDGRLTLHHHDSRQLKIDKELKQNLIKVFKEWMNSNNQPPNDYKVLDARCRLAGTGSIGIHRYVFLIEKKDDPRKHMLIDMKEAMASSLEALVPASLPAWNSQADRIIYVQKMMQNVAPAQLSSMHFDNANYVLQELQPSKDRIDFKMIEDDFKEVCCVIEDMAVLTASAHLRGVSRKGACSADELIEFGSNSNWIQELIQYAVNYKTKSINDYKEFCARFENKSAQAV